MTHQEIGLVFSVAMPVDADGAATAPPARPLMQKRLSASLIALPMLLLLLLGCVSEANAVQDISQTLNQSGSTGHMNNKLGIIISLTLIFILPLVVFVWLYNGIIGKEEKTLESWAQVEAAYQRRADLIPGLIETIVKYVKHEHSTLVDVTEARNGAVSSIDDEASRLLKTQQQTDELARAQSGKAPVDEKSAEALVNAQNEVSTIAHRLLATAEAYPQLRASDQFMELQAQFEGTENRILAARNRFNEAVEIYNATIRKLPGSLIASVGNFQRKAYFRSESGAHLMPERRWN